MNQKKYIYILTVLVILAVPVLAVRYYRPIDMNQQSITNVPAPTGPTHAVNKEYVDLIATNAAEDATLKANTAETNAVNYADTKVSKAGDEMTGDLVIKQQKIVVDETTPTTPTYVIGKDGRIELHVNGEVTARF